VLTLWDLISPVVKQLRRAPAAPPATLPAAPAPHTRRARAATARPTMQDRYDRMAREQLSLHGVRVRRYRTAMTGIAWQVRYRDGSVKRLIEAPRPKGPMSAAIFLHEIGHHAIGFDVYKPRCLEEYHAWAYSLSQMERYGLNITAGVRKRMHNSLAYAIAKARRRGIKQLPSELTPFTQRIK
jgi:hypothetical protein